MDNWSKGDVKFNLGKKPISFSIYNNLPNVPGLRLEDAVTNWLARTDEYTDESLCAYIMSKDINLRAYTASQFANILLEIMKEEKLEEDGQ